jgi:hypothetical protein
MRKAIALVLVLTILTTSCASYTAQSVTKPAVESAPFSRTEDDFTVGVTPFVDPEQSKKAFDADLKGAGILALQVIAHNNKAKRVLAVRKSDIALRLPDNKEFTPAPASAVAARFESVAGVVGATIAFGLIGLLIASGQREKADSARRADFTTKEFQDATLAPQESAHGFLFFLIPDDVRELKDVELSVRGLDAAEGAVIRVSVPLGNLGTWHSPPPAQPQRPNF